jgi:hypothetical protein
MENRDEAENTASFSDSHPLRTRLSRVHENGPQLEGNADNHVWYVTSANATCVLRANFEWRAEIILRPGLPDKIETSTQTYQVLFKGTLYVCLFVKMLFLINVPVYTCQ